MLCRNEFDPQDIKIPIDDYKIFEIKGHEIPLSALPAGTTSSRWTTLVEEVRPQDIPNLKHKVLGVMVPPDVQKLKQLEREIALYPSNNTLKEEFNDSLLRSCSASLIQVKEYHAEERALEIRTITSEILPSNYLFVSKFKLPKIV